MTLLHSWVKYLLIILFAVAPATILAGGTGQFDHNTAYSVCFTPGGKCTDLIVSNLSKARKSIYVQAYQFTSPSIAQALSKAKTRGVDIYVILDKSQQAKRYTIVTYLLNQGIPIWIDKKPAIAHNKVIIIDNTTVITGSFNFTLAAEHRNAENVLIINDYSLARIYLSNWMHRQSVSQLVDNHSVASQP